MTLFADEQPGTIKRVPSAGYVASDPVESTPTEIYWFAPSAAAVAMYFE
jgi:hypothetical protein